MHLWDTAMLPEAPGANEGNEIQAKFAMRKREAALLFGMRANRRARTCGGVALTDGYSELENPLQGDSLPPSGVRDPQGIATRWTSPLKRPQDSGELRFGFGGAPGHRLPPCAQQRPALPP